MPKAFDQHGEIMFAKNYMREKLKFFYYKYPGRPKTFRAPPADAIPISCRPEDITLLTATSNNILKISYGEKTLFFRQCRLHTEIHEYVQTLIEEYYCSGALQNDRELVEKSLAQKKNFSKLVGMGVTNDVSSGVYRFCMGGSSKLIGIINDDPALNERLRDFAQFVWGELYAYKLNSGIKTGSYQTYHAVRQIATKRIADLFCLSELVPRTAFAVLNISDGRKLFGTVMEAAPGIILERESARKRKSVVTPGLQHALNNLNFLDVLCHEKDHRPGNYTVVMRGNKAESICAFDNDSPMSFGLGGASFASYMNCSPYILHHALNRPYIDEKIVKVLSANDFDVIYQATKDLLNPAQITALKRRFHTLQKAVSMLEPHTAISEEEWSDETVREELSGAYGKTYLALFTQDLELAYQPWIQHA